MAFLAHEEGLGRGFLKRFRKAQKRIGRKAVKGVGKKLGVRKVRAAGKRVVKSKDTQSTTKITPELQTAIQLAAMNQPLSETQKRVLGEAARVAVDKQLRGKALTQLDKILIDFIERAQAKKTKKKAPKIKTKVEKKQRPRKFIKVHIGKKQRPRKFIKVHAGKKAIKPKIAPKRREMVLPSKSYKKDLKTVEAAKKKAVAISKAPKIKTKLGRKFIKVKPKFVKPKKLTGMEPFLTAAEVRRLPSILRKTYKYDSKTGMFKKIIPAIRKYGAKKRKLKLPTFFSRSLSRRRRRGRQKKKFIKATLKKKIIPKKVVIGEIKKIQKQLKAPLPPKKKVQLKKEVQVLKKVIAPKKAIVKKAIKTPKPKVIAPKPKVIAPKKAIIKKAVIAKKVAKPRVVAPIVDKLLPKKELPVISKLATKPKTPVVPFTAVPAPKVAQKPVPVKTQKAAALLQQEPEAYDFAVSAMIQRGKPQVVAERIATAVIEGKETPPPEVEEILEKTMPIKMKETIIPETKKPFPWHFLLIGVFGIFALRGRRK